MASKTKTYRVVKPFRQKFDGIERAYVEGDQYDGKHPESPLRRGFIEEVKVG